MTRHDGVPRRSPRQDLHSGMNIRFESPRRATPARRAGRDRHGRTAVRLQLAVQRRRDCRRRYRGRRDRLRSPTTPPSRRASASRRRRCAGGVQYSQRVAHRYTQEQIAKVAPLDGRRCAVVDAPLVPDRGRRAGSRDGQPDDQHRPARLQKSCSRSIRPRNPTKPRNRPSTSPRSAATARVEMGICRAGDRTLGCAAMSVALRIAAIGTPVRGNGHAVGLRVGRRGERRLAGAATGLVTANSGGRRRRRDCQAATDEAVNRTMKQLHQNQQDAIAKVVGSPPSAK